MRIAQMSVKTGKISGLGGEHMKKNMKIIAGIAGLLAAFFGIAAKGQAITAFQEKLCKIVKVDTAVYLVDNQTIGQTPGGTNKSVG